MSFLNKARELLISASNVIPTLPIQDVPKAISNVKETVHKELTSAEYAAKQELHQLMNNEAKAKRIETMVNVSNKIISGSRSVGNTIGASARSAINLTKTFSIPLIEGVKEGYYK